MSNSVSCYRCDAPAEYENDSGYPLCPDCWIEYRCEQDFPPEPDLVCEDDDE
jgi:hypothetical protein